MHVRRVRITLWLLAVALTGASVVTVILGAALPYVKAEAPPTSNIDAHQADKGHESPAIALSAFARLWDVNLRRPLYDSPTPAKTLPKPKPPAPLNMRLVGTMIEPGHSMAMFITKGGRIELRRVGQTVAQAKVVTIQADRVKLMYHGREHTLMAKDRKKP